jgi:hypothetical protein
MSNSGFISFLVDETIKLQSSGEYRLSSLEQKLFDYDLKFMKGEFIPQTQVLRFEAECGLIDIPVNWSLFAMGPEPFQDVLLDEDNDPELFFQVMKSAWNFPFERMLISHADGFCYLIALKRGEEAHIHDLLNPQILLKTA